MAAAAAFHAAQGERAAEPSGDSAPSSPTGAAVAGPEAASGSECPEALLPWVPMSIDSYLQNHSGEGKTTFHATNMLHLNPVPWYIVAGCKSCLGLLKIPIINRVCLSLVPHQFETTQLPALKVLFKSKITGIISQSTEHVKFDIYSPSSN